MQASGQPSRKKRRVLLPIAAIIVGSALFVIASGHWHTVYRFLVQFHQRSLWTTLLILAIPVFLVIFLRAWGVEDVPYEEEPPALGSGRLRRIVRRIGTSQRNVYRQALLVDQLSEIAAHVVAINEGLDVSKARKLCRSGEWTRHPVIASLIRERRLPGSEERPFVERFERVLRTLEKELKGGTA
jgi:hypothetical protein